MAGALPAALEAPLAAAQALLVTFERWLLQLKALRRMVVFGFPSDARSLAQVAAVGQVAPPLLATLQQFVGARSARSTGAQRNQVQAMLDRAILKLLKTLRQIQEAHPWCMWTGPGGRVRALRSAVCRQMQVQQPRGCSHNLHSTPVFNRIWSFHPLPQELLPLRHAGALPGVLLQAGAGVAGRRRRRRRGAAAVCCAVPAVHPWRAKVRLLPRLGVVAVAAERRAHADRAAQGRRGQPQAASQSKGEGPLGWQCGLTQPLRMFV